MNTRALCLFSLLTASQALGAANSLPAPLAPDYNGDGFSDILFYGTEDYESRATAKVHCRGMAGGAPALLAEHTISTLWRPGWQVFTGDFDGDGSDDIFLYDATRGKGVGHLVRITEDCHTLSSVTVADQWRTTWEIYPGDFDGDGADDLFLYDPTGNKGVGHLVRFNSDGLIYSSHPVTEGWRNSWEIIPGDFDGDGADDLFLFDRTPGEGVSHLVRFNAQGLIYSSHPVGGQLPIYTEFHAGDFDGDGDYDLLTFNREGDLGAEARILRFDTNGNIYSDTLVGASWDRDLELTVADLNGDDRADAFLYRDQGGVAQSFAATFTAGAQLASFTLLNGAEVSGAAIFPGRWWDAAGTDLMKYQVSTGDVFLSNYGPSATLSSQVQVYRGLDPHFGFNGAYDF